MRGCLTAMFIASAALAFNPAVAQVQVQAQTQAAPEAAKGPPAGFVAPAAPQPDAV